MKKVILILLISTLFYNCEKPGDCVKSTGSMVFREVAVNPFEMIKVYKGISLVIKQGENFKVEIKSGENLIDDIEVKVQNNTLILKDNTSCNWVRDYGETTVYITAPNITEIRSKTEQDIISEGVLTYPSLKLISMDKDGDGEAGAGTGDFVLQIDNSNLSIENNNVSRYYISGKTNDCYIGFYNGNGIVKAENLEITNFVLFHRGFNDIHVQVLQSVTGDLFSTGNLVLHSNPPVVEVVQHYQGSVIYN